MPLLFFMLLRSTLLLPIVLRARKHYLDLYPRTHSHFRYLDAHWQDECRGWDINELVFSSGMWPTYQPLLRADFTIFDEYQHSTGALLSALGLRVESLRMASVCGGIRSVLDAHLPHRCVHTHVCVNKVCAHCVGDVCMLRLKRVWVRRSILNLMSPWWASLCVHRAMSDHSLSAPLHPFVHHHLLICQSLLLATLAEEGGVRPFEFAMHTFWGTLDRRVKQHMVEVRSRLWTRVGRWAVGLGFRVRAQTSGSGVRGFEL